MIELLCTDYNKKATSIHYYFGNAVLELKWWDWPEERITKNIHAIQTGQLNELI